MEQDMKRILTRREVLARAFVGLTAVVISPLFLDPGRERREENREKNISNRDASFYRKLAG